MGVFASVSEHCSTVWTLLLAVYQGFRGILPPSSESNLTLHSFWRKHIAHVRPVITLLHSEFYHYITMKSSGNGLKSYVKKCYMSVLNFMFGKLSQWPLQYILWSSIPCLLNFCGQCELSKCKEWSSSWHARVIYSICGLCYIGVSSSYCVASNGMLAATFSSKG